MKVIEMEFLEGVVVPGPGSARGGSEQRFRAGMGKGEVTARTVTYGVVMSHARGATETFVPWGNIRFAVVEKEDGGEATLGTKKRRQAEAAEG